MNTEAGFTYARILKDPQVRAHIKRKREQFGVTGDALVVPVPIGTSTQDVYSFIATIQHPDDTMLMIAVMDGGELQGATFIRKADAMAKIPGQRSGGQTGGYGGHRHNTAASRARGGSPRASRSGGGGGKKGCALLLFSPAILIAAYVGWKITEYFA